MGADETGTICLIFADGVETPPCAATFLARGKVRWVPDKGALALFVDAVIVQPEPGPESVPQELVFCRSAPVTFVAVHVVGGEDPESYRVLVRKSKTGEFELPGDHAAEHETARDTAVRVLSTCPATVKVQLTALDVVVIDLGPSDEDNCPQSLVLVTARHVGKVKGAPAHGWLWLPAKQAARKVKYIYTCIHIYMFICIHVYIYTCIHIYMIHVYIYTYVHIYIYTYIHIYIYTYIHDTCIHVYIYTYIHARWAVS
jgi:hypothetical protein